jgi:Initiator Replication protein
VWLGALSQSSHLQSVIENVVAKMYRPQFFFLASLMKIGTAKDSIGQRPPRSLSRKNLEKFLPISVQKSYFMLSNAERDVLNRALEKYQPGQSEPILVGVNNLLKPALRLMTDYRLMIEEIQDAEVITSYTRWVEAVQVRGAENREVYLPFSPRFERIWLESKKRLPEYIAEQPANIGLRSQYALRLYNWAQSTSRQALCTFHWRSFEKCSDWSRLRARLEISSRKHPCSSGRTSAREPWMSRSRRSMRRRTYKLPSRRWYDQNTGG